MPVFLLLFLYVNIFFLQDYIPQISDDSMCTDSFFIEVALFNTQWRRDVSLKITAGIKQKYIIRTELYCRAISVRSEI